MRDLPGSSRLLSAVLGFMVLFIAGRPQGVSPADSAVRDREDATRRRPSASSRKESQPDSVLALVGDRLISRRELDEVMARTFPDSAPPSPTPQTRRQFLQLMVDKDALALKALSEPLQMNALQQAEYRATRDRLMLGALLDSLVAPFLTRESRAASRDSLADAQEPRRRAEIALRESTLVALGPRFEPARLERVAAAFRALPEPGHDASFGHHLHHLSTVPHLEPADSSAALGSAQEDTVRGRDLLHHWQEVNPFSRPRVESVDQVKELIGNVLFERHLRRMAERLRIERRPPIQSRLAKQREFYAVSNYVDRVVWKGIPQDSLTLKRLYAKDPAYWAVPARARVIRLDGGSRPEAESLAVLLRDPVRAESLRVQSGRAGAGLEWYVNSADDQALHAELAAAGQGAVVGPFVRDGRMVVVRVLQLIPRRERSFSEAETLVRKKWMDEEGERRMRALLDRLRGRTKVWIRPDYRSRAAGGVDGARNPP